MSSAGTSTPPQPPALSEQGWSLVKETLTALAGIGAALYVVGYVIISGYFNNWRAIDPGLSSTKYIAAGCCFLVIAGTPLLLLEVVFLYLKHQHPQMQLRWKLLIQSVTVILGAALFLFMIGLLSVDNWEYFSTEVYYNLNQIVRRQVWSLIACYSLLLPIPALIDAVIENIKAGKHLWCFIWIFISLVLVLFSGRFFGYQVFAFTSAVYGGGVGVEVHFAADAKCVDTLKGCGVTFSVDPTVSDKVWLIWETEHALIVVVHYGTKALPDANSPALAMAVRKPDLFRSIEVW